MFDGTQERLLFQLALQLQQRPLVVPQLLLFRG